MSQNRPTFAARTAEHQRLLEETTRRDGTNWKRWGPYLADRQWGTVREDYSPEGNPWTYFTHEDAQARAYRWGEDGLLGITDRECRLCFSLALWNHADPCLKERLFGLTGPEGNHGEDVKEVYHYLDATPTASYLRAVYKYPQAEFPYARLRAENQARGYGDPEFELADTGVFAENRYFEVQAEYAKAADNDILARVTITNRGPETAPLTVLGQLWLRNTWTWACAHEGCILPQDLRGDGPGRVEISHETLGDFSFYAAPEAEIIFTNNDSNNARLFGSENDRPFVKDAFHRYIVEGEKAALNPRRKGTKSAAVHRLELAPGEVAVLRFRLGQHGQAPADPWAGFEATVAQRRREAEEFYESHLPGETTVDRRLILRQAFAGLIWNKQFYYYSIADWLDGDPAGPKPPRERLRGRNRDWRHLYNRDIISMPDKWEYPWYAAWDSAFHMVAMAAVDPAFAKSQLTLLLREWYMSPAGQLPAYEFEFSDVNPPVHAWACWRVYKMADEPGKRDFEWLASVFHKLLINFTWWVNRKDPDGKNLFAGGFLGLDNIGVFDRSSPVPNGGALAQADGTAWMAFYCGTMLSIALELARCDRSYTDVASKFFEHFMAISEAINHFGGSGLWHEEDGFYYDQVSFSDHDSVPVRVRSIVGLVPLCAVELLDFRQLEDMPDFRKRMDWFLQHKYEVTQKTSYCEADCGTNPHLRLLAIPTRERLERALSYLLSEAEFLSPYGVRSLSAYHREHPYTLSRGGQEWTAAYTPGESDSGLFGGNSNWRGPVWFPLNFLFIEALQKYHHYYGNSFKVEFPTGSGVLMTLDQIAIRLSRRLIALFEEDAEGKRPALVKDTLAQDHLLFHEYFHGDTGQGLGASHQTGWTALVAKLIIEDAGREARRVRGEALG
jgi:hypothetical protein